MVLNRIPIAIGLLFVVPVGVAAQGSEFSEKNANEFARSILQNEVNVEANDHSHWMFKLETEKSGRKEVDEVVETKAGELKRPILINGRPPTATQEHDADEQIRKLTRDSNALHKATKQQDEDSDHSQKMLKMLPDALIFRFGERRGNAVQLHFTPNPLFRPTTREAQVFQAMEGELWVVSKQRRLMGISGHLIREVKFGGGFLGHLNAGGEFEVKQAEVAPGYWELTLLNVNMKGQILFFKTISVQQKENRSDFHKISDDLSVAEGANLLRKPTVVGASLGNH